MELIVKFLYSEKATKFCKISTLDLSYVVPVKSTVGISQTFVTFSEYMNFNKVSYKIKASILPPFEYQRLRQSIFAIKAYLHIILEP